MEDILASYFYNRTTMAREMVKLAAGTVEDPELDAAGRKADPADEVASGILQVRRQLSHLKGQRLR